MGAHEIPRFRVHAWTHKGYEWRNGKILVSKGMNYHELSSVSISYLFISLCIPHPICLCVAMIG